MPAPCSKTNTSIAERMRAGDVAYIWLRTKIEKRPQVQVLSGNLIGERLTDPYSRSQPEIRHAQGSAAAASALPGWSWSTESVR